MIFASSIDELWDSSHQEVKSLCLKELSFNRDLGRQGITYLER